MTHDISVGFANAQFHLVNDRFDFIVCKVCFLNKIISLSEG